MTKEFNSFSEFYPYYLHEHRRLGTRISHFIGTTLFFVCIALTVVLANFWFIFYGVLTAYFFAWIGHFFIEKNKPATFKYPFMSLRGDFKLYFQILAGKEKFRAS